MKKMILFIAVLLIAGTTAQANDHKHEDLKERVNKPIKKIDRRYRYSQPIIFVEEGTRFFVYPNGEVDFRLIRRRGRHHNWNNEGYNTPGRARGHRNHWNSYGPTVRYDYYGRLKRVGMVTLSYNQYDQVRRIGRIMIRYNRRGLVSQIGGLRIFYNRYGRIRHIEGNIHYTGCGYCGIDGCSMSHDPYYDLDWNNHHDDDHDDDDYYYKNGKKKEKKFDKKDD